MRKILTIGLLALTILGCDESLQSSISANKQDEGVQLKFLTEVRNARIYKFEYEGTVCFIYNEYESAAMSCKWQ